MASALLIFFETFRLVSIPFGVSSIPTQLQCSEKKIQSKSPLFLVQSASILRWSEISILKVYLHVVYLPIS